MNNLLSVAMISAGFLGMWVCALYAVDYLFTVVKNHFNWEGDAL